MCKNIVKPKKKRQAVGNQMKTSLLLHIRTFLIESYGLSQFWASIIK